MRNLLYMNTIKFLILLHERFRATEQKMHRKRMKSVYLFGFLQVCFISDDGFLSLDQLHFQIGAVICQLTLDLQCTFESDEVMTKSYSFVTETKSCLLTAMLYSFILIFLKLKLLQRIECKG